MASNQDVLKEYLLALGFRIDEKSSKDFDKNVDKFDKRVKGLAKATFAVGLSAQAMVLAFSRSMEQLYYKSRLADSTASNLQALGYAGSQIGLSADGIQSSVQKMASAIRQNPGLIGLLNDLRIPVQGRDMSDVFKDLVRATKAMPHYIGAQYAGLFGISPEELILLQDGLEKMIELEEKQKAQARAMGLDWDKATESGKEYSQLMREMAANMKMLGAVMAVELLPYFREFAKTTNQILQDLPGVTREVAKDWKRLAPRIADRPGDTVRGLLEVLGLKKVGEGVHFTPYAAARLAQLNNGSGESYPEINSWSPLGLRNNNPGNLRRWKDTPIVSGFAAFDSPADGLRAMAGNLRAYQRMGLTSLDQIISRWAPASENNTAAYISAVSKATGFGAGDALNLNDPEVMQKLMAAMIKQEQGYNPFSSAELSSAISGRLGGVQMQQTTNINVYGSGAADTASKVAEKQSKVNGDMARNLGNMVTR